MIVFIDAGSDLLILSAAFDRDPDALRTVSVRQTEQDAHEPFLFHLILTFQQSVAPAFEIRLEVFRVAFPAVQLAGGNPAPLPSVPSR